MRSQLYTLKLKAAGNNSLSNGMICAKLGYDAERQEQFISFRGRRLATFQPTTKEFFRLSFGWGFMFGRNIAFNDRFRYRPRHGLADRFVSLEAAVYSKRHTIFNAFGAQPFTYVKGWLSSFNKQTKKELELGIGCYIKPLGTHVSYGVLDVNGSTITPSSRFRISVDLIGDNASG